MTDTLIFLPPAVVTPTSSPCLTFRRTSFSPRSSHMAATRTGTTSERIVGCS